MEEDGILVKADEDGLVVVAAEGTESVAVKADNNEHRVAELSLDEGDGGGGGEPAKGEPESSERAGPGPIDNRALGEGRELREGMMEGEDYVLLHNRAYELLEAWYSGGPRFKRWVVSLGSNTHTQLTVELFPVKFVVYTCLPDGKADKESLKVQLYSREKTMRQVCADVKSSLNLTARVDTRLSLKKLEAEMEQGGTAGDAAAAAAAGDGGAEGGEDDGWQEIHLEEVSQLLHEVMGDTQMVALLVETKDTSDPSTTTSFPRDHILLRWRLNLKVGDLIDARDSDKIWFESRVTEADVDEDPEQIKVHFLGWAEKWDQVFKRGSDELQKLHTFTMPWRQDLQVTSKCEVSVLRGDGKRWYAAAVGQVKHENGQRMLFIEVSAEKDVPNNWFSEDSEEICKVNTHIKPEDTRTISRARSGSGSGTGGGSYGFRRNTKAKPLARGAVGLSNLGNTCFMNSMLQCLLATESLSTYFRNQHWKREVNEDNPLGMAGKMAAAYAGLSDDAWSGEYSVVVPHTIKKVVSQYAPMFAGYQQHDASELMSFLLDGIHEDLNRVHKKPYMETVDSAGRADLVVAEESWRRYLMRNDSIMVDNCTGLLRSHVTCPECQLSSVTFDPYTSLSLPLVVDTDAVVEVLFHPLPYGTRPVRIAVTLEKDNKVRALKTAICERYNAEFAARAKNQQSGSGGSGGGGGGVLLTEDHLSVMEVWSHRVFKGLDDASPLADMLNNKDEFVVCQLEFPLGGGSEKKAAGVIASAIPASPTSTGLGSAGGSSWSGQTSSQGTGEADVEGGGGGGGGGGPSVLIDLVLATHPHSPLRGKPLRITCRHGVTNNELHSIVRRHVSRFVPSLKAASKQEGAAAEGMAMGEQGTQEAGISTTSDIDGDYVHVPADPVALDSSASSGGGGGGGGNTNSPGGGSTSSNGDASPFVHVKKSPAVVVSDGDEPATAAAAMAAAAAASEGDTSVLPEEMDVDEVWSGRSGAAGAAGVSGVAAGTAVLVSSDAGKGAGGSEAADAEATDGGVAGEGKGKGKRKEGGAELPYVVLKSDYTGTTSAMLKTGMPTNDEAFEVGAPRGYSALRGSSHESITVKIQFLQDPGGSQYQPHSLIDMEEMDASETHPSATEAQEAQKKRQSVPIGNCFEKFTECEQLGTSELWYCSRCKTHRQAYKKLDVYTAPDVLIVVLKRFLFDSHTGNSMVYRQKLDTHVSFPIEGLDLTSNIQRAGGPISKEAPPIYDLYAVSEHSGSLRAGHYTAIAQNFEDKKWYSFNDSQVSPTSPDQGPSSEPYVLFYRRRQGVLRWAGMGRDHAA